MNNPNPLLLPYLPHKTTLYTPSNVPIPCILDPLSSHSFTTLSTLQTYFPPSHLHLQNTHTPLPSILPSKLGDAVGKVKTPKFVKLEFGFMDLGGEKVMAGGEVWVSAFKGLEGRVLLGVDFLRGCGGVVEYGEGKVLCLGARRIRVEGIGVGAKWKD
jgi:hypothetical protein